MGCTPLLGMPLLLTATLTEPPEKVAVVATPCLWSAKRKVLIENTLLAVPVLPFAVYR